MKLKPRKSPQQKRSQELVEAICDAAARILAEKGYAGANTNLIAAKAGVSVGSLYQYFSNKDELISAIHERHSKQLLEAIKMALKKSSALGLRKQIDSLVNAVIDEHLANPKLHRALESEFSSLEAGYDENEFDQLITKECTELIKKYRNELGVRDFNLAGYFVMRTTIALSHAAILDDPKLLITKPKRREICDMIYAYLTFNRGLRTDL